jgi:hypothetical protein
LLAPVFLSGHPDPPKREGWNMRGFIRKARYALYASHTSSFEVLLSFGLLRSNAFICIPPFPFHFFGVFGFIAVAGVISWPVECFAPFLIKKSIFIVAILGMYSVKMFCFISSHCRSVLRK